MLLDITINKIKIIIGVSIVSRSLKESGTNKNKIKRKNAPQIIDVIAAIELAFLISDKLRESQETSNPKITIAK